MYSSIYFHSGLLFFQSVALHLVSEFSLTGMFRLFANDIITLDRILKNHLHSRDGSPNYEQKKVFVKEIPHLEMLVDYDCENGELIFCDSQLIDLLVWSTPNTRERSNFLISENFSL